MARSRDVDACFPQVEACDLGYRRFGLQGAKKSAPAIRQP
jgi:hypothetical protein